MGAICSDCGGDMLVVATCVDEEVELVDGTYPRVRWGFEGDDWGRPAPCGDCGVQLGGIHHWAATSSAAHGAAGSSSCATACLRPMSSPKRPAGGRGTPKELARPRQRVDTSGPV
jgi:hypothetical protein